MMCRLISCPSPSTRPPASLMAAYSKPCPSTSTRPPASTPDLVPLTPSPAPAQVHGPQQAWWPLTPSPAPAQVHGPQQAWWPLTPDLVPLTPSPVPAQVHSPQQAWWPLTPASLMAAYSKPCGQLPNQSHASLHALTKHLPQSTVLGNLRTPRFRYLFAK